MFEANSQSVLYRLRDIDRYFQNQELRPYRSSRPPLLQSPVLLQIAVVLVAVLAGGAFFA